MKYSQLTNRKRAQLLVLIFLLTCASCANLRAIRDFADISVESARYEALVNDYVESPERQKRYQPEHQHETLEKLLSERKIQKERLLLRLQVVQEYMSALGQLAENKAVDYNTEIDALGNAVKQQNFLEAGEAEAITGIAKVLLKAVTDNWRQKKLKSLIAEANAPFQEVVGALIKIVQRGFKNDFDIEKMAMGRYYETIIHNSDDPAGIAALREWKEYRLAQIDYRGDAIETYAQLLQKIADGHQTLFDERDKLSNKVVLAQIELYSKDLKDLYKKIKAL